MTESGKQLSTEAWFDSCPAGLLILDPEGRVQAINSALCNMLQLEPGELVGRNREDAPSPELQGLFYREGQLQLYAQGIPSYQLQIQSREIPDTGGMTLNCFTDITAYGALREENDRLRQQVEELTLTDELTGLANERAFHRVLASQVTRSRRYGNPLCLAVVEIEAEVADAAIAREVILAVSRYLRDRLRWADLIARWNNDRFMLILPETNTLDGSRLLDKIKEDFADITLPETIAHLTVRLQIGLAEWQKGNDTRLLMKRTMEALNKSEQADAYLTS